MFIDSLIQLSEWCENRPLCQIFTWYCDQMGMGVNQTAKKCIKYTKQASIKKIKVSKRRMRFQKEGIQRRYDHVHKQKPF